MEFLIRTRQLADRTSLRVSGKTGTSAPATLILSAYFRLIRKPVSVFSGVLILFCGHCSASVFAEIHSLRERVVDLVILSDGTRLYGTALNGKYSGFLVSLPWVRKNLPEFHQKVAARLSDSASAEVVRQALRSELMRLERQPDADLRRIGMIREVLVDADKATVAEPELVLLQIAPDRMRRHFRQSPRNQRLGLLGLLNSVSDIEQITWREATERLQKIPPDRLKTEVPVIGLDVPDETAIAARTAVILAAVDHRLSRVSRFVLVGKTFIPEDGAADFATLLTQLQQQFEQLSGDADIASVTTQDPATPSGRIADLSESAIQLARQNGHQTVLVSQFELNQSSGEAVVHRTLFHELDNGTWLLTGSVTEQGNSADVRPEKLDTISNDPQVAKILKFFEYAGADASSLSQAVRTGGAVEIASQRATAALEELISAALKVQPAAIFPNEIPRITPQFGDP